MNIEFIEEDYAIMEATAKRKLGWTFSEKCGMTIKAMVENPSKGKLALRDAKAKSGFKDKIVIGRILSFLEKPNWKEILKEKLG